VNNINNEDQFIMIKGRENELYIFQKRFSHRGSKPDERPKDISFGIAIFVLKEREV
jgi:hypothetical protein